MLGAWIGSVDGIDIGSNEVTKLGLWDGKSLDTELGYAEGYTDAAVVEKI